MLRWIRRLLALGTIGGGAWWWRRRQATSSEPTWPTIDTTPAPRPANIVASEPSTGGAASPDESATVTAAESFVDTSTSAASAGRWVAPVDGACPDGYPVKANDSSKIFHLPGGGSYERTVPERCYATAEAAEADGYRRAKR